jgi:ABC-2 type transport system permease protein
VDQPTVRSPLSSSPFETRSSPLTAFVALTLLSFQRHARVRQMGWVALGLLGLVLMWDATITTGPGWGLENRRIRRTRVTYREYGEQLLPRARYDAVDRALRGFADKGSQEPLLRRPVHPVEYPAPLDPLRDSLASLVLSIPHAVLQSEKFLSDWSFANFSRWLMIAYLGFVLPMFTLAYAGGAIAADRENRSLIWLLTRPMPRPAIYLANFLGALPWCLLFSAGGFAALCLAGGEPGRIALKLYWPAALIGTLAFSALFHLAGALVRRPVIVGLVYVFFFEFLVGVLPGSLKLLSLSFYTRSLMYNGAVAAGYPGEMLEVAAPVSAATAWAVLLAAAVGLTLLGMWLFSRAENRDDV